MPTSRIRNYVRKNPDTIEEWRLKVLRLHIIRELTNRYCSEEYKDSENFSTYDICGNRGQLKICADILHDHYDLAFEIKRRDSYYGGSLHLSNKTFEEMTKDLAQKPVFEDMDVDKTEEHDIYALASDLSLPYLVYIYQNQDEFCYIDKAPSRYYYRNNYKSLGIFWKDKKEEADNIAFRNAIDAYYADKIPTVAKIVCDKDTPDLVKVEYRYGDDESFDTGVLSNYHRELIPQAIDHLSFEKLDVLVDETEYGIEKLQKTLEQLKELRDSIKEAGGSKVFREQYYQKMLENFYQNLPLFINVEDERLKSLAKRAMKRKFT